MAEAVKLITNQARNPRICFCFEKGRGFITVFFLLAKFSYSMIDSSDFLLGTVIILFRFYSGILTYFEFIAGDKCTLNRISARLPFRSDASVARLN